MQTGLDQTLLALADLQKNSASNESRLRSEIEHITDQHIGQVNRMMDNILDSCVLKTTEALYEFQNPSFPGNQAASPEFVLSILEKTMTSCQEFARSFTSLTQVMLYDISP